ncbi:hypothetical protein MBLNU13_g02337t3 [Cladosporium sp. NU13]
MSTNRTNRKPEEIAERDGEKRQEAESDKSTANGERDSAAHDGGDQEKQQTGPSTVGFWDWRLNHVRKEAFLKWTFTTAFLMAFILGCLSIYWGAFLKIDNNLHSLRVYVVDFDGRVAPYDNIGFEPVVGPMIVQLAQQMVASPTPNVGFTPMQPSDFNNDPLLVREAVYNWDAWAAIIINPNATALLYSAVQNGNASYDPMGACQLVYQQARDDTNWSSYLFPHISQLITEATSMVGQQWTNRILQQATSNQTLQQNLVQAPQALSPAIGFSMYNLRPFYPYVGIPAQSIGLIYLIIVSFFSFSFYLPIHFKYLKPDEGHPTLKFYQLILWRWCATISAYFMLSLAYSLISLAFMMNFGAKVPHTGDPTQVTPTIDGYKNANAYGHGTFPGMIALGLACENVAMIVGQPWTGLWLIFWVITNVSTAFYDIELGTGIEICKRVISANTSQHPASTTSDTLGRYITSWKQAARSYLIYIQGLASTLES